MIRTKIYVGMTTQKGVLLNADEVRDLIKQNKDACTIQQATGIWKGEQENTLVIEIIQEEKEREPKKIVKEYCQGVDISNNIYGTLIGRNVLFSEEDPLPLVQAISAVWKDDVSIDIAIKKYFEY